MTLIIESGPADPVSTDTKYLCEQYDYILEVWFFAKASARFSKLRAQTSFDRRQISWR